MTFKIHTALAVNCIKNNLSEPYFIWLIGKNLSNGKGSILIQELKAQYLNIFGLSNKSFYNHFNKGLDIFYSINNDYCYLRSLQNISNKFESLAKINACFEINSEIIVLNKLKPKQLLINCVICANKRNKPLSLWYISKVLGLDRATVIRNIHKSIVRSITNSRADKSDLRKFWSSYIFIGGKRLSNKKEKPEILDLVNKIHSGIKLKKIDDNSWEIFNGKIK